MILFKRQLPLAIVFLTGIGLILCYYSPARFAEDVVTQSFRWVQIITAFTLIIGIWSLIMNHWRRVSRQQAGWAYSVVMFVAFIITSITGLFFSGYTKSPAFLWIFDNVNVPATATVFSILAFYICSAAYRAFRVRNFEATVMLVAAVIVMFGRIPFGDMLSEWLIRLGVPKSLTVSKIVDWLMNVEVTEARRALRIGIALSVVATSMRIIFGIERTYMGGKD
ncbi:MAG: hypothetical protein Kow0059_04540 [Candidatus Sumerlaeia bacterium]